MTERIHVVAAVITDPSGRILIAKRPANAHQGGLWEFPGGKVEPEEAVETALKRELAEELDIEIEQFEPFITVSHDYSDKSVFLDVWKVTAFRGQPCGLEGQEVCWVSQDDINGYDFPEANREILEALLSVSSPRNNM